MLKGICCPNITLLIDPVLQETTVKHVLHALGHEKWQLWPLGWTYFVPAIEKKAAPSAVSASALESPAHWTEHEHYQWELYCFLLRKITYAIKILGEKNPNNLGI